MLIKQRVIGACLAAIALAPAGASAEQTFNVMGTWSTLSPYNNHEAPFWNETLPAASDGQITASLKSMSELNVKGYETLSLLKNGVFDFAHATIAYVTGNVPELEGSILPRSPRTWSRRGATPMPTRMLRTPT